MSEITVELAGLSASKQAEVLALEVADVVDVTFTPNSTGDAITQDLVVNGIAHELSPDSHRVTLAVIAAQIQYFRLDSATYGVLDGEYVLAF